MLLLCPLVLIVGSLAVVPSESRQRFRGITSNTADGDEDVPQLSLFIPPLQLFDIISSNNTDSNDTALKAHLILEPLLALLNEEEVRLLVSIFPNLFPPGSLEKELQHPSGRHFDLNATLNALMSSTSTPSSKMTTTTASTTPANASFSELKDEAELPKIPRDPLLAWLFHGKNTSFEVSTKPSPRPLVGVTDDMLFVMLQRLMENVTTHTTVTPPSKLSGPVGIGEDLLSVLLKTLHTKAMETTTPMFDDGLIFDLTKSTTTTSTTTSSTTTTTSTESNPETTSKASNRDKASFWPERVKPGGGISDEAILQIIQDVQEYTKNESVKDAAEINADSVAQIIHDVQALQNTTAEVNTVVVTTDGAVMDATESQTKGSNKRKKPARGGKTTKPTSSSKSRNSTKRRRPARLRATTRRPSLWERIVKAATNAFFGETKPATRPGLFQAEDIMELIGSL